MAPVLRNRPNVWESLCGWCVRKSKDYSAGWLQLHWFIPTKKIKKVIHFLTAHYPFLDWPVWQVFLSDRVQMTASRASEGETMYWLWYMTALCWWAYICQDAEERPAHQCTRQREQRPLVVYCPRPISQRLPQKVQIIAGNSMVPKQGKRTNFIISLLHRIWKH